MEKEIIYHNKWYSKEQGCRSHTASYLVCGLTILDSPPSTMGKGHSSIPELVSTGSWNGWKSTIQLTTAITKYLGQHKFATLAIYTLYFLFFESWHSMLLHKNRSINSKVLHFYKFSPHTSGHFSENLITLNAFFLLLSS